MTNTTTIIGKTTKTILSGLMLLSLTSCINLSNLNAPSDRKLADIICRSDQQCKQNYHDSSWLGEQRRDTVNKLLENSGFDRGQLPDVIEVKETDFDLLYTFSAESIWANGFSHFQHRYNYRLLDIRQQKEIKLIEIIADDKVASLRQTIRLKFNDYIDENKSSGWMATPQTEQEKIYWLDENMDDIFNHYGRLERKDDVAVITYCSNDSAQANVFYGCVSVPAKPYLKDEYL